MRECKCGIEMEELDPVHQTGRYWCPVCGRHCQSYACHETIWKTPEDVSVLEDIRKIVGERAKK